MKKIRKMRKSLVIPVLILSLGLVWAGCSGGGSSVPPPTPITDTTQGAQAAALSAAIAEGIVDGNSVLFGFNGMAAPQLPFSTGSNTNIGNMFKKFAAKVKPVVEKARSSAAAASAATDVSSYYCSGGTAMEDITSTTYSLTFADCKDMGTILNGILSITMDGTLHFGTTGSPFTIASYEQDMVPGYDYGTLEDKVTAAFSMTGSGSQTGTTTFTVNMIGNGYFEYEDFTLSTTSKGRLDMTNYSLTYRYDTGDMTVADTTANGRVSASYYENSGSGYGSALYSETNTFYNLRVVSTLTASTWTFSINGTVTVDLTPDSCFEGTFSFVTDTPVTFDLSTLQYTAGQITINGNTVIEFNYDYLGGVRVIVSGTRQSFNNSDFDVVCPLL